MYEGMIIVEYADYREKKSWHLTASPELYWGLMQTRSSFFVYLRDMQLPKKWQGRKEEFRKQDKCSDSNANTFSKMFIS